VSNFTYLKIKKGEPGTHESGVITNWKERKKKFQMTARRGNTAKAAPQLFIFIVLEFYGLGNCCFLNL
jgi:hypothetical protein